MNVLNVYDIKRRSGSSSMNVTQLSFLCPMTCCPARMQSDNGAYPNEASNANLLVWFMECDAFVLKLLRIITCQIYVDMHPLYQYRQSKTLPPNSFDEQPKANTLFQNIRIMKCTI